MNQDIRLEHEIEQGKYLASAGAGKIWNWESPAGKLRWERRVEMLSSGLRTGDRVLELGCGTGYFTRELAKLSLHITACDISPDLIEVAKKEIRSDRVHFEIQNAYHTEYEDDTFDAIVGSSVLHHLEIEKAVREIFRLLKIGGYIAFTEPNMMNPQIALQKHIPWLKRKLGDSPDETAFFRWEIRQLLVTAGFRQVRVFPFDFLHPAVPRKLIGMISSLGAIAERTPFVKEIAGSLYIKAVK
jgi:2-polyprenyl-3-methyl-5-hydroxy-6-metoxy-1,4-benzoquinol methylase